MKFFEMEKGELHYDKEDDVLYVSFNDTEKGKWVELKVENLQSKSTYFQEDDTLWVKIADRPSCESEQFSGERADFIVDFDEEGEPVSLEILGWKRLVVSGEKGS